MTLRKLTEAQKAHFAGIAGPMVKQQGLDFDDLYDLYCESLADFNNGVRYTSPMEKCKKWGGLAFLLIKDIKHDSHL